MIDTLLNRKKLGAIRNYTSAFQKYRNDKYSRIAHFQPISRELFGQPSDGYNQLLIQGQPKSDIVIEMNDFQEDARKKPPSWVELYEDTTFKIRNLQDKIGELRRLHQSRIKPKFNEDDRVLDKKISACTHELYETIRQCEDNIKQVTIPVSIHNHIEVQSKVFFMVKPSVRKNVSQSLAGQVQEIAKNLRKMEKDYYVKRKEIGVEEDFMPTKKENTSGSGEILNDAEAMEFYEMEQVAVSRDVEIQNLVKGINDLAVIFKELSVLVVDQGNILDRIDYNIEQAVRHTKKANVQLHKSEEYQTSRIRTCIVCLIVAIMVMLIILIIKHT